MKMIWSGKIWPALLWFGFLINLISIVVFPDIWHQLFHAFASLGYGLALAHRYTPNKPRVNKQALIELEIYCGYADGATINKELMRLAEKCYKEQYKYLTYHHSLDFPMMRKDAEREFKRRYGCDPNTYKVNDPLDLSLGDRYDIAGQKQDHYSRTVKDPSTLEDARKRAVQALNAACAQYIARQGESACVKSG